MLGILCGLTCEADLVRSLPDSRVVCSASNLQTARNMALVLASQGATRLLSFGFAGGLDPALAPGSVVIATAVQSEQGFWVCSENLQSPLHARLPEAVRGPLWGAEDLVTFAANKRNLHQTTRCLAVDMESQPLAASAAMMGIPFMAVRVVLDTADQDLPLAARVPLREGGGLNHLGIFFSVLLEPWQIPALVRLGRARGRALQSLKRVVQALKD